MIRTESKNRLINAIRIKHLAQIVSASVDINNQFSKLSVRNQETINLIISEGYDNTDRIFEIPYNSYYFYNMINILTVLHKIISIYCYTLPETSLVKLFNFTMIKADGKEYPCDDVFVLFLLIQHYYHWEDNDTGEARSFAEELIDEDCLIYNHHKEYFNCDDLFSTLHN